MLILPIIKALSSLFCTYISLFLSIYEGSYYASTIHAWTIFNKVFVTKYLF